MTDREPVWCPDPTGMSHSRMASFMSFCEAATGRSFRSYESFHGFSVEHYRFFWGRFLDWSALSCTGDREIVCTDDRIEQARFFPNVRLNYARVLLSETAGPGHGPALRSCDAEGRFVRLSRARLTGRVAAAALSLRALGVDAQTRVAMVAFNDAQAVAATLSVAALGGAIAMAAPEMGAEATIARLRQVEPRFLFCHGRTPSGGGDAQFRRKIAQIAGALPSLRAVVLLDPDAELDGVNLPCHRFEELVTSGLGGDFAWPELPFNHPLFILFSSGTTGAPKAMVHGAGGTLVEHLKEQRLHCGFGPGDRLLFQSSTAWMMWNWSLSALASGVELVLHSGPVEADTLWKIVAEQQATVFGTSPAYLQMGERAGIVPRHLDLSALRAILSTGSLLYEPQQAWVSRDVKTLPVQSISGGTDIIGCFVMGNPMLPAYAGEPQCKGLAFDLDAIPSPDQPSSGIGELVCRNPFPSRPLGFLHDPDGSRFHAAYFAQNPGLWTQGDLVEFKTGGSVAMHGRSDGVMNIRGIRVGPAEIYRVLEGFAEVEAALAVEQRAEAEIGHARIVLLLMLRPGFALDQEVLGRLRRAIGQQASAAHVPAVILQVDDLPTTHTGKRSERSARDAVNGRLTQDNGSLRNPECLAAIAAHPGLKDRPAPDKVGASALLDAEGQVDEGALTALWEEALSFAPIGPDDDFFDLGGDSLAALRLLLGLERDLGRTLPIVFIYQAPTVARMAAELGRLSAVAFSPLVPITAGCEPAPLFPKPFFIVHGLGGNVIELFRLGRLLDEEEPVYAIQAQGLDGKAEPLRSVQAMARLYVDAVCRVQPKGPYRLCGYSFGGLVAFEMARQLEEAGEVTRPLILLDTSLDEACWPATGWPRVAMRIRGQARGLIALRWRPVPRQALARMLRLWRGLKAGFGRAPERPLDLSDLDLPPPLARTHNAAMKAMRDYRPRLYGGEIVLLRCTDRRRSGPDAAPIWASLSRKLTIEDVPGSHHGMLRGKTVEAIAGIIRRLLADGERTGHGADTVPELELVEV